MAARPKRLPIFDPKMGKLEIIDQADSDKALYNSLNKIGIGTLTLHASPHLGFTARAVSNELCRSLVNSIKLILSFEMYYLIVRHDLPPAQGDDQVTDQAKAVLPIQINVDPIPVLFLNF